MSATAVLLAVPNAAFAQSIPPYLYGDPADGSGARCMSSSSWIGYSPQWGGGTYTVTAILPSGGAYLAQVNNGQVGGFTLQSCQAPPPTLDCDSLNDNPETAPGEQLFQAGVPPERCVGAPGAEGCQLVAASDSPLETVQGRVAGQPVVFYRYQMTYSGETCNSQAVDRDDEFNPDPEQPDRQCHPTLGVCINNDGDTEYCTFNADGTPSACVPAVDYDNDGIPDGEDGDPSNPQDPNDDGQGDESDNQASGGATCTTAPSCTGDGIACLTLYQQWKTRCAVEALRTSGGVPGGSNDDPFDKAGERSAINGANVEDDGLSGLTPGNAWAPGGTGEGLNSTRFGTGGGCPTLPAITIGESTLTAPPEFCTAIGFIRLLFLAIAGFWALRIVAE